MPGHWAFENRNARAATRCVFCEKPIRERLPMKLVSYAVSPHGQQYRERVEGFAHRDCGNAEGDLQT